MVKRLAWLSMMLMTAAAMPADKQRIISYRGRDYLTTWQVPENFIGRYQGRKGGYLLLRADGTGEYKYDVFGLAPADCPRQPITLIWGFLLDEQGELVRRQRDYGYSYPLLLQSTGRTSFQGCRQPVMMDYLLDKGEYLHIASSDDWRKAKIQQEE